MLLRAFRCSGTCARSYTGSRRTGTRCSGACARSCTRSCRAGTCCSGTCARSCTRSCRAGTCAGSCARFASRDTVDALGNLADDTLRLFGVFGF
ncbi:MAG: hypothetical protein K2O04_04345 [Clostridiales bacterium]|nr:hypothetical protein [Clostridiales bacterium]